MIEMVVDRVFIAPGHEDELFDPRLARLLERVVDQRLVHDRQHLLGHGFSGGEKARPQPAHGKHDFAYLLRVCHSAPHSMA
jgi:hypothetical protein